MSVIFWLKNRWFGLLISAFLLLLLLYFAVIFASPRYDMQNRGFIPCTEKMAEEIIACKENRLSCTFMAIWRNNLCDLEVIHQGWQNWRQKKQPSPWSNYLFIPELPVDELTEDPVLREYYKNHPDTAAEMEQLQKLNKELEKNESAQN